MNYILSKKLYGINDFLRRAPASLISAIGLTLAVCLPANAYADSGHHEGPEIEQASHHARTIEITGNDMMKFDITELEATAGESIIVSLKNIGKIPKAGMAHNFVLLKKGVDAQAFSMSAMMAGGSEYIPQDRKDDIIVYSGMAGPGETVTVEFTVPQEPGTYEFVCTFPGHFLAGMKGVLTVKAP